MTKHEKLQYTRHLNAAIRSYREILEKNPHRLSIQDALDDCLLLLAKTQEMGTTD